VLEPGSTFAGRFEVLARTGAGGMGVVYRALDRERGVHVALKVMAAGASEVERFEREARVLAALDHPAIVRHVAHGTTDGGEPWLAMEWLEGRDLARRLEHEGVTVEEAIRIAERVASALRVAHEAGVIHRDLKPSNVFLEGDAPERARLLDFGIARRASAETRWLTATGVAVGTPAYMAPEQARAERDVDARADLYALGATLFHALTGRPPFEGDGVMVQLARLLVEEAPRLRTLRPEIPPALDDLVADLLATHPSARPASAGEVLSRLSEVVHALEAAPAHREPGRGDVAPTPAISRGEQRAVCVVLALDDWRRAPSATAAGQTAPTLPAARAGRLVAVRAALRARWLGDDVHIETLGEGVLACVLPGAGIDEARTAARVALMLRRLLPTHAIVLSSARTTGVTRGPLSDVISRAIEALRARPDPESAVMVDPALVPLLEREFEIEGRDLLGAREDEAQTVLGPQVPCVGRERDLAILASVYDEVSEERVARAVLVTGEAGVGKSRLRREQLGALALLAEPPQVLRARGDVLEGDAALGVVSSLVREALRAASRGGAGAGAPLDVAAIEARLTELDPRMEASERRTTAAFLAELAGASGDADAVVLAARRDPMVMTERVRRAVLALLTAMTEAGAVVVVIEDGQWCDAASIRLLGHALRELAQRPLMLCVYARNAHEERFEGLVGRGASSQHGATTIRLGPLGRRATERLAERLLAGSSAAPELVASLAARADGNPFFLEELVRSARAGNTEAPGSVIAMVQRRLGALGPEVRRALRATSIVGARAWRGAVATVMGEARDDVVRDLIDELVRAEILRAVPTSRFVGETEHAFVHDLVREAAYELVTEADRVVGHRLAAAWLHARDEHPAVLAEHWARGQEPARAIEAIERAIERALGAGDTAAGETLASRAEELAHASGLWSEALDARLAGLRAELANLQNDLRRAVELARHALPRAEPLGQTWARAAMHAVIAGSRFGDASLVEDVEQKLLAPRVTSEHPLVDRVRALLARQRFVAGDDARGTALIEALSRPLAEHEAVDPSCAALIHGALVHCSAGPAHLWHRYLHVTRSLELGRAELDYQVESYTLTTWATVLADLGQWEGARQIVEQEIFASRERSAIAGVMAPATIVAARVQAALGSLDEAVALFERAIVVYTFAGDRRRVLYTQALLAEVFLRADDPRADGLLGGALPDLGGVPVVEATYLASRARHALARGALSDARGAAERVLTSRASDYLLDVEIGARRVLLGSAARQDGRSDAAALDALAQHVEARLAVIGDDAMRARTRLGLPEVRAAIERRSPV
jgi:tetratricopeptide (TPR) repeat protein